MIKKQNITKTFISFVMIIFMILTAILIGGCNNPDDGYEDSEKQYKNLNELSWSEIDTIAKSGNASTAFDIGDEIDIVLSTNETITVVILGFNHDNLTDGSGKAAITFGMKDLLAEKQKMNYQDTNGGSWKNMTLHNYLHNTVFAQLPQSLQDEIKTVDKKTSIGATSSSIITYGDKLFIPSYVEIYGITDEIYTDEGTQYDYWKTHTDSTNKIKKLSNGSGAANSYWLRSPNITGSVTFIMIDNFGFKGAVDATILLGVSFCFCI